MSVLFARKSQPADMRIIERRETKLTFMAMHRRNVGIVRKSVEGEGSQSEFDEPSDEGPSPLTVPLRDRRPVPGRIEPKSFALMTRGV